MGSREIEKMQRAKRRLAAVTFLTNISLDGSYKDTGWCQEHARAGHSQQDAVFIAQISEQECSEGSNGKYYSDNDYDNDDSRGRSGLGLLNENNDSFHTPNNAAKTFSPSIEPGGTHCTSKVSLTPGHTQETLLTITPVKESHIHGILNTKLCKSEEKENTVPNPSGIGATLTTDLIYSGRKRANTSEFNNVAKGNRNDVFSNEGDGDAIPYGQTAKHAHFSSAESIETGVGGTQSRLLKLTGSSGIPSADTPITISCQPPPHLLLPTPRKGEVKFFNLRENPHSLTSIKNERLVIVVAKRTPCVVFSSIPYKKSSRFIRVQDRVQEGLKRTRNVSGNRPLSSLSEPADPLEQLLHDGDKEISYGHLLKPSNHPSSDPTLAAPVSSKKVASDGYTHFLYPGNGFECPPPAASKHHSLVSRCMSYDGVMKSSDNATAAAVATKSSISGSSGDETGAHPPTLNNPAGLLYNPTLLDDPELRAGRHRTLMTFPSYMTSVIDYCKGADLKKELNDKFRERFPHIQLTLSKMRSLKREMRRVAKSECNVDLLTVAQAYVYFEKLILGSFVTKFNRKYCAGACLLLSAKLNDIKGDSLHLLLEKIETTFRVNRKDLLSFEFAVLVALEFALLLPAWEVAPHYQRLIYDT